MGEEKKEDAAVEKKKEEAKEIVLKVDMHCQACARKVVKALKGFQGVEEVRADCKASKVVVKAGKGADPDPIKVGQRIQKKSGRKVEIISPLPNKEEEEKAGAKEEEKKDPPQSIQENKQEPPAVINVVLKVRMHCEGCAQALQKRMGKVRGVESVTTDIANERIIVKGVVEPEKLVKDVYKRTGKHAEIVKEEEKKEEEKKVEKQEEKKEEEEEDDDKKAEIKKMEHWPSKYYMDYAYAPQMFSDENPNACLVM